MENRDASISAGKHIATHCKFRSFSSTSIDRRIRIDRFGVEKPTFDFPISLEKCAARKQKNVRAPKTAMRRFYNANIYDIANAMIFSTVFDAIDRVRLAGELLANGAGWAGLAGLAGK